MCSVVGVHENEVIARHGGDGKSQRGRAGQRELGRSSESRVVPLYRQLSCECCCTTVLGS